MRAFRQSAITFLSVLAKISTDFNQYPWIIALAEMNRLADPFWQIESAQKMPGFGRACLCPHKFRPQKYGSFLFFFFGLP